MHLPSISSLTTRLLVLGQLLCVLMNLGSLQPRSGVSSVSLLQSQTEIIEMVLALPDDQCLSDPLPTWLLKKSVNVLAPFLCWLFCRSLEHNVVPSSMKSAYIMLILKKADLDSSHPKSYRPISNLLVLSKLLEHLVSKQLVAYLLEKIVQISSQLITHSHGSARVL